MMVDFKFIVKGCFFISLAFFSVFLLGLYFEFVVNADYSRSNELLEPFGNYSEGVVLAVSKYPLEYDLASLVKYKKIKDYGVCARYFKDLKIIKIEDSPHCLTGENIGHELGHKFWHDNMNESQRENFCATADWEGWSYDGSCEEGFAEMKGLSIFYEK